jgi:putative protein-disulfide isomerase
LLRDLGAVFDSEPPITAMLAADALRGQGPELLARVQTAHYVEGRRIAEAGVLVELAVGIGLDAEAFERAFLQLQGDTTREHIQASRALLARVGGSGFPTFVQEHDGRLQRLDTQAWYGSPQAFAAWLREHGQETPGASLTGAACSIDGCAS